MTDSAKIPIVKSLKNPYILIAVAGAAVAGALVFFKSKQDGAPVEPVPDQATPPVDDYSTVGGSGPGQSDYQPELGVDQTSARDDLSAQIEPIYGALSSFGDVIESSAERQAASIESLAQTVAEKETPVVNVGDIDLQTALDTSRVKANKATRREKAQKGKIGKQKQKIGDLKKEKKQAVKAAKKQAKTAPPVKSGKPKVKQKKANPIKPKEKPQKVVALGKVNASRAEAIKAKAGAQKPAKLKLVPKPKPAVKAAKPKPAVKAAKPKPAAKAAKPTPRAAKIIAKAKPTKKKKAA